jgi:hypothetical protein
MAVTTHSARITGPVVYLVEDGRPQHIPLGPCLVEQVGERMIDIIWGLHGQRSAVLPWEVIEEAQDCGNLVLLD